VSESIWDGEIGVGEEEASGGVRSPFFPAGFGIPGKGGTGGVATRSPIGATAVVAELWVYAGGVAGAPPGARVLGRHRLAHVEAQAAQVVAAGHHLARHQGNVCHEPGLN